MDMFEQFLADCARDCVEARPEPVDLSGPVPAEYGGDERPAAPDEDAE